MLWRPGPGRTGACLGTREARGPGRQGGPGGRGEGGTTARRNVDHTFGTFVEEGETRKSQREHNKNDDDQVSCPDVYVRPPGGPAQEIATSIYFHSPCQVSLSE